jgi:hypothetical protein
MLPCVVDFYEFYSPRIPRSSVISSSCFDICYLYSYSVFGRVSTELYSDLGGFL